MTKLKVSRKFQDEKGARLLRKTLVAFKPEDLRPFSQAILAGGRPTDAVNDQVREFDDLRYNIRGDLRLLPTHESTPLTTSEKPDSRSSGSSSEAFSDIELLSIMSFSDDWETWYDCQRPKKPGQLGHLCEKIYRIEYGGDYVPEFPELCYALGHLIVTADLTGGNRYFTKSYFVAVVDVVSPQKPVWLVQDLYNLGFCADARYDIDLETSPRDPDEVDTRDMDQLFIPDGRGRPGPGEPAVEVFFQKLREDNVDMIQLFPSLQAWEDAAKDPADLVQRMLRKERGCRYKRAKPRMYRATADWLATSPTTASTTAS